MNANVYVPKPGKKHWIAPRSAIVGGIEGTELHVFYEGNIYEASNIVTFGDRAYHAFDRGRQNYPTIAQGWYDTDDFVEVGRFDPTARRVVVDEAMRSFLEAWLEGPVSDTELRMSGADWTGLLDMHDVPDPPTQEGCTSCGNDLHHGLRVGDRVVVIAPMTKRMPGAVIGFALDKADVRLDEREYPLTVHSKWLAHEEKVRV